MCFNLIKFDGIIEMDFNITLVIKNNAKKYSARWFASIIPTYAVIIFIIKN